MRRLAYWFRRLVGTVPCATCFHPRHAHETGDCFRVLPACAWCREYAARLREGQYDSTLWRGVLVKSTHSYVPEPYR